MSISAVNCTPIKPQVSFGKDEYSDRDFMAVQKLTDDLNDTFVNSDDIKKPAAVAASVALAGVIAFVSGKKIASTITKIAPKLPEMLEGGLRKGANFVKNQAAKLQTEAPATKLEKAKDLAGKAIGKTESFARNLYKKVATGDAVSTFKNAAGLGAVATVVPTVCSKDNDGDGVSDIMQKGTNAYTGTKTRFGTILDNTSKLADLAEILA